MVMSPEVGVGFQLYNLRFSIQTIRSHFYPDYVTVSQQTQTVRHHTKKCIQQFYYSKLPFISRTEEEHYTVWHHTGTSVLFPLPEPVTTGRTTLLDPPWFPDQPMEHIHESTYIHNMESVISLLNTQ